MLTLLCCQATVWIQYTEKCSVFPCVVYYRKHPAPVEPQAYLHDLHRLPIFCNLSKSMSTAQCVNMLLDPELQRKVVCKHVPFGVNCNSSFIIDMNCLSDPKDILCDDMGT